MNDTDLATAGTAAQTRPTCSMCGAVVKGRVPPTRWADWEVEQLD